MQKVLQGISPRRLAYTIGCATVVLWTILRFWSAQATFDLVGQQVLAHQWLTNGFGGADIGITHYLPKIFLLYMPMDFLPGDPFFKLMVLTALANVATLFGLMVLVEKIYILLSRQPKFSNEVANLGLPLLVVASVFGSVFWAQYTNSRNLEIVAGLWLVFYALKIWKGKAYGWLGWLLLAVASSLVIFFDRLQLFTTAVPLTLVFVYWSLSSKKLVAPQRLVFMLSAFATGAILSFGLIRLSALVLKLNFLVPSEHHLDLQKIVLSVPRSLASLARLLGGDASLGRWRLAVNLFIIASLVVVFGLLAIKKRIHQDILSLSVIWAVSIVLVYIASGQANQDRTERYLIMIAPVLMIVILAVLDAAGKRLRRAVMLAVIIMATSTVVSLGFALQKQRHGITNATVRYSIAAAQKLGGKTYASMDIAHPAYYATKGVSNILPLECHGQRLRPAKLFFDRKSYHRQNEAKGYHIIMAHGTISNHPFTCSAEDVVRQFGRPATIVQTPDGLLIISYDGRTIL